MLLVLEEYFKEYPVKKKIVETLYNNGVSIKNGKFFLNNIEISLSSIAESIKVNRRTVYETIKFVNKNEVIKKIMENVFSQTDTSRVSLLMGSQIVTIYINKGSFARVYWEVMSLTKKYTPYIKEMYCKNSDQEETFIKMIFYNEIDSNIYRDMDGIAGIKHIVINSPVKINVICNKCEIKICPHKISSEINKAEMYP